MNLNKQQWSFPAFSRLRQERQRGGHEALLTPAKVANGCCRAETDTLKIVGFFAAPQSADCKISKQDTLGWGWDKLLFWARWQVKLWPTVVLFNNKEVHNLANGTTISVKTFYAHFSTQNKALGFWELYCYSLSHAPPLQSLWSSAMCLSPADGREDRVGPVWV